MRAAQSEVMPSYGVALIRAISNDGAGGEIQTFTQTGVPFRCAVTPTATSVVLNNEQRKTDTSAQQLSVEYGAPDMVYQDRVLVDDAYTFEIVSRLAGRVNALSTVDTYSVVSV